MQNSGLGNAINPLISIAHKKVYFYTFITSDWMARVSKYKDEPQHMVKGKITKKLLKLLNISFCVLEKKSLNKFNSIISKAKKEKRL